MLGIELYTVHVKPQITAKHDLLNMNYYGIRFLYIRRTRTSRWFLNWWSLVLIILCLSIELHQHHVRMVMVTISWHVLAVSLRYKKIPGGLSQYLILSSFGSKISLSLISTRVPGTEVLFYKYLHAHSACRSSCWPEFCLNGQMLSCMEKMGCSCLPNQLGERVYAIWMNHL